MSDFCQVSEQISENANENICRWPDNNVPWTLTHLLPGLNEKQMVELLQPWFAQWRRIKVWYVERAADARVLVGARYIDGVNGVLADCYLPCGNVRSVRLQFDVGDQWTAEKLGRVARHEFGHGIGLGHAPQSSANWMAPFLNRQDSQGEWDDREEKRRYPDAMPPPLPPTTPLPPVTPPAPKTPTSPTGGFMGGLAGLLDLLNKIGPILQLIQDFMALLENPAFRDFLDKLKKTFAGKQGVSADDLDALANELKAQAQAMRAP